MLVKVCKNDQQNANLFGKMINKMLIYLDEIMDAFSYVSKKRIYSIQYVEEQIFINSVSRIHSELTARLNIYYIHHSSIIGNRSVANRQFQL